MDQDKGMGTVHLVLPEETREVVITNDQQEAERLKNEGWTPSYEPFMFGNNLEVWFFYNPTLDKQDQLNHLAIEDSQR